MRGAGPAIYGHRGGAAEAPENTLAAIAHARRCGAQGVELDVRRTADGHFVVFHDDDLTRLAGRSERLAELSLAEARRVELHLAGGSARMATLEEALEAAGDLAVDLDLKWESGEEVATGERLARALAPWSGRAGLVVTAFEPEVVAAFAHGRPEIPCGWILEAPPAAADWRRFALVSLERGVAAELGREARGAGLAVLVWTVDDPGELDRYAADVLISNRPAHLVAGRGAQAARSIGL